MKIGITLALLHMGWGAQGYAWAVVCAGVAGLALMVAAVVRLASRLERTTTAGAAPVGLWLRYAWISYGTGQASNLVMHLDRFILGATTVSAEAVGTLMVVRQLQQLPVVFHQMFIAVVAPMFAAAHGTEAAAQRQALYHLATEWVMRLALPLIGFLAVFGGPLLLLYGGRFRADGTPLLMLYLLAVSVTIVSGPTGPLMIMVGLEKPHRRISWLTTCITIALYGLGIPLAGLEGVGVAVIASTLFINLSALWIMRQRLAFAWCSSRYVTCAVSSAVTLAALLVSAHRSWLA